MKKILLSISACILIAESVQAQNDTLIWADFETDPASFVQFSTAPPGVTGDTSWYNFDYDGLPDGSGSGRPLDWFWDYDFSDTLNSVLMSSSWTNGSTPTENWLITKSIYISDANAVLSWKSAPYQTPRYLDGYWVLISTTNNDFSAFTDTAFKAGEYVSLDNSSAPNNFSSYTFTSGFVHGADGLYTVDSGGDSSRLGGLLRPFTYSLSAYAGKSIYIAFKHHSVDDNLLEIDDILVTGTNAVGLTEQNLSADFTLFPNPAADKININLSVKENTSCNLSIYDVAGRVVLVENLGSFSQGKFQKQIDLTGLASGMYQVKMTTDSGSLTRKFQLR
ncbi:MAG: T9SS type A sorting domain-containing protein [Bacteroidota bacterium]|jgi:hypothetical protein